MRTFLETSLTQKQSKNLPFVVEKLDNYSSSAPSPPNNLIEALEQHPKAIGAILELGVKGVDIIAQRGNPPNLSSNLPGGTPASQNMGDHLVVWTERLSQVSPIEGAKILEGVEYALHLRDTLRKPTGGRFIKKNTNVAFAEIDVTLSDGSQLIGDKQDYIGVSGQKSPEGTLPTPTERVFEPAPLPDFDRDTSNDSEVKILEAIAAQLLNSDEVIETAPGVYGNLEGTVTLFTERERCNSCRAIIDNQWGEIFPNIKIDVIEGPRYFRSQYPQNQN